MEVFLKGGISINYNAEKLNKYLNSDTGIDKIEHALIALLIIGNLFTFIAAITDPYDPQMFNLITRLEIAMSIVIIFTIFIVNRRRNILILFAGISYFFAAITFAAAIYKKFVASGITSTQVITIEILIFVLVLLGVFVYHSIDLKTEKKMIKISFPIVMSTLSASLFGVAIARITVRNMTDMQISLFYGICLMFFMVICIARVINIHRYYLIKKYSYQLDEESGVE